MFTIIIYRGSYGINGVIFGGDIGSSMYVNNKVKDMLILSEGPTQGLTLDDKT